MSPSPGPGRLSRQRAGRLSAVDSSGPAALRPRGSETTVYAVRLVRSARKELEALSNTMLARVAHQLDALAADPRPPGCKKLRGASDIWRVRVGTHRVIYRVDDSARHIEVQAIRDRKDAYG